MKSESEIPSGYARVTEILSPYNNFTQIDPNVLTRAADRGSRVHKYCESYALGLFLPEIDEDCKNYVERFIEWFDERVEEVIFTEKRINDPEIKISGQFDLLVTLKGDDGRRSLIDIKTPENASKSWKLQTAAYRYLCWNNLKIDVDRRLCLQLPKFAQYATIIEYTEHLKDEDRFLNAVDLYWFFKNK